ncbi:penicillin-binding protein activator [Chromobacterium amazonense]|uniref:penicillin-binding protein activator n=1 Tax=Chromobacterium amazonense TaxID=1382803 RepID=UPI0021B7B331|nr:penicillin-binding protein activator [Chromobacterium amazonense]MBM2885467.1 penicillin-binding protein activator [Chromobacterium amazonense]MDE1714160.1 penicillin-binding protein activator [Chromobacterium amazonense]
MQRLTPLLLVSLALTWLTPALAQTPDYIIQSNGAPMRALQQAPGQTPRLAPAQAQTAPAAAALPSPAPAASAPAFRPANGRPKIKIGLILPNESAALGEAAAVVRSGVEAAAQVDQNAELVSVDATTDNVVQRYRAAVADGVNVVIGPLSRGAIAQLAPAVTVPTLALNSIDRDAAANAKLFSLSLIVEGEARQLAQLMRDDGRANPLLVVGGDALSQRLAKAFADEWRRLNGKDALRQAYDPNNLPALLQASGQADSLALALDAAQAGKLKAALTPDLPVYGTSQLNAGGSQPELAGVRFIDMPWFLMPDHPAVKRYPRPTTPLTAQTERLYALGIDAYRLAVLMAGSRPGAAVKLDGVTGDLKLGRDRVFERQLPAGVMGGNALQ